MEQGDAELVLACRAGDQQAWDRLVSRYERLIFSVARRAGLDADQSAEVLQRVFTILVERLDSIAQPERIGAWLVGTARYESWRVRRRARTFSAHVLAEEEVADQEDDGLSPDELVLIEEERHQVRAAVAKLDDRCRWLIELLFYQERSVGYAEIGATLGMSAGSIGPTRARCLEKLRRALERLDP